ncbi:MAG: hypothetical protein ACYCST_11040 [Acidimicrobiales bacterium]
MGVHLLHGVRRGGLLVVGAALAIYTTLLFVPSARPDAAAATAATVPSELTLKSQAPAFVSSQSGVTLGVEVNSALPAARLSIEVTLYSAIVARYTLRQTLAGALPGILSPLGNPGVIPLDLKGIAWVPGKELMLHLPVSAPDLPATGRQAAGTGGVALSIFNCAPPTCGGVYPLQVSLLQQGVGPVASFTTYLIVTPPSEIAGTHPLQFAWVIPLGATRAISPSDSTVFDHTDIAHLTAIDSALEQAPRAAVSLDVFPQFLESLRQHSNPKANAALSALRALNASARAAIVPGPFTPVNLEVLVNSNMASAVTAQLARSRQVLASQFKSQSHEYAVNGPLGKKALGLLERSGITRIVIPSASLQPLAPAFAQWTPTAPFLIPGSGVEAIASDPGLEEDLASGAGPALRAQQMLADLSIQYFDDSGVHQAVAVESAAAAQFNKTFLDALLSGLSQSPILHAVTLADVFDTVAPGSSATSPDRRLLSAVRLPATSRLGPQEFGAAQQDLAAIASVVPATLNPSGKPPLGDLLLMAEGAGAPPRLRRGYLETIFQRANALGNLVSLPLGRTITVTSLQAKVPISIVSDAHSAFTAELSVASTTLGFPAGNTWRVRIYPRTNIVPIMLSARTSGDFSLQLRLKTATGFTIKSGAMTIRSTAISGVAVALSIGAAAFLLIWWSRSIVTKRRKQHRLRGAALAAGAIPDTAPDA